MADRLRALKSKNPKYFFWSGTSGLAAATSLWRKRPARVFKAAKVRGADSHRFRDTLLSAGVSMQHVSTLLAHASIKVTEKHYAPWDRTRQDALDTALAKVVIESSL